MKPYIEQLEKFIGKMEVDWKEKTLLQSGMILNLLFFIESVLFLISNFF
jgi:hypothetical protein